MNKWDDFRYILGLLFMSVMFSNEAFAFVMWSDQVSPAGRWILIFVPFFNVSTLSEVLSNPQFGVMLASISTLATGDVNPLSEAYIPPQGFAWADLYKTLSSSLIGGDTIPPRPINSWCWSLMNMILFLILAW